MTELITLTKKRLGIELKRAWLDGWYTRREQAENHQLSIDEKDKRKYVEERCKNLKFEKF